MALAGNCSCYQSNAYLSRRVASDPRADVCYWHEADVPAPYPRMANLAYTDVTSSSEGRIMRRREVRTRCGVPAGWLTQASSRGGVGLPPGPLRDPARSWLTTLGSTPNADDRLS